MPPFSLRKNLMPLAEKIVLALNGDVILNEKSARTIRNHLSGENGGEIPRNLELVEAYRLLVRRKEISPNPQLLKLIRKRKIRTLSGIANVTVLTRDLGCPGECIFCPTEKGMPKSYLSNEPAMMRAVRNGFDSYRQVRTRLNGLHAQGHDTTKIDIRIAGGTWGAVPRWYRESFIKGIFRALNEGVEGGGDAEGGGETETLPTLEALIRTNETAECRCVGLWIETRPDWVNADEIRHMRQQGITGIELGVQTTDDAVNAFCKRGHGVREAINATRLLRDAGFKVCHHLMPNLPTATVESDLRSGRDLFANEGLRPDYLKVYPTMVTPFSELAVRVKENPDFHRAYSDEALTDLLAEIKKGVPEYCRIIRIIRDIPAESVIAGTHQSNLRQVLQRKGVSCRCIRCREVQADETGPLELTERRYATDGGTEVFLSMEDPASDKLAALCRLRLPAKSHVSRSTTGSGDGTNALHGDCDPVFPELDGAALVRELHVYGQTEGLGAESTGSETQHKGMGRRLMGEAERIAREAGYLSIAVIAAIGTREYYRKIGYRLSPGDGGYMMKKLR